MFDRLLIDWIFFMQNVSCRDILVVNLYSKSIVSNCLEQMPNALIERLSNVNTELTPLLRTETIEE
jgi:hypothetical protein